MAKITKKEQLADGQLIKVFGQKSMFAVYPAPEIDRVRFTIVDLGTNGKEFIDIYLTTEEVRSFCADIDNGVARAKFDADTGNYPSAYQWAKGENAAKRLTIGGGSKVKNGVRVNMSHVINGTTKRKNAVVLFSDLQELSFLFKLTYGLIPVTPGSHYDQLFQTFVSNIGKYKSNYDESEEGATIITEPAGEIVEEPYSEPEVKAGATSKSEKKSDGESDSKIVKFTAVSNGPVEITKKGNKAVPITVKETGETSILVFTPEQIENISWFAKYEKKVAEKETSMNVIAEKRAKHYAFVGTH